MSRNKSLISYTDEPNRFNILLAGISLLSVQDTEDWKVEEKPNSNQWKMKLLTTVISVVGVMHPAAPFQVILGSMAAIGAGFAGTYAMYVSAKQWQF